MEPSSRTPDGLPNRCRVCGNEVRVDPSHPSYDAPCPFCGSLMWFDSWFVQEPIEETPGHIRIEFTGGCKDGIILENDPGSLAEEKGYRYYRLAKSAEVGMRVREVPFHEYGKLLIALVDYIRSLDGQISTVDELTRTDVEQITQQLQHVTVHVYEVTAVARTENEIRLSLRFIEEGLGV